MAERRPLSLALHEQPCFALFSTANAVVRAYSSLAERGEALVSELTKAVSSNPVVQRVSDLGERASDDAKKLVGLGKQTAGKAQDRAAQTLEDVEEMAQRAAADARDLGRAAVAHLDDDAATTTTARTPGEREDAAADTARQTAARTTAGQASPASATRRRTALTIPAAAAPLPPCARARSTAA